MSKNSSPTNAVGGNQSSCSVYQSSELNNSNYKEAILKRGIDVASTRTSSIESENPRTRMTRKACMDLNDAIALLDEIYSNNEVSPRMTPKTPRTPLTPHLRNKRARSKSSDNSSNYNGEKLNERFLENTKSNEKNRKRTFLKKIGLSMTEDKSLLTKFAPKIMGKPYLEKIGPTPPIDRFFFENIGSSKTLDKFIFNTPKIKKKQDVNTSNKKTITVKMEDKVSIERQNKIRGFTIGERRKSGKNFLLKMYSFETEDLEKKSLTMKASYRDPLRGASLDNVVDSGSSSVSRINKSCAVTNSDVETPSVSVTKLVKCRVTTSEEILSSNSCLNSSVDVISWKNSAKRKEYPERNNYITVSRSKTVFKDQKNNVSVPNSPTKKLHISSIPKKNTAVNKELDKVKSNRQISEEILDKRKNKHEKFERLGVSSDNLTKERVITPVFAEISGNSTDLHANIKGSNISVVSITSDIKHLHDRYESQEICTESYVEFKRRTQSNVHTSNALKRLLVREKTICPLLGITFKDVTEKKICEASPKFRSKSVENNRQSFKDQLATQSCKTRTRSMLQKQQGIDHSHYSHEYNEFESNLNECQKLVHEPSQETLDLLSELQKVKSLLKAPLIDKSYKIDNTMELKAFPKRILLTDKEFCLSIERENSIKKPASVNALEVNRDNSKRKSKLPEKNIDSKTLGPALFEKRCLSLDYADEEKSMVHKTESKTLFLTSAENPHSEDILQSSEIVFRNYDSKSSNISNTSINETIEKAISGISVEKEITKIENEIKNSKQERLYKASKILYVKQVEKDDANSSENVFKNDKKNESSITFWQSEKIETIKPAEEKRVEVHDNSEHLIKQKNHYLEVDSTNHNSQVSPKKKSQGQINLIDSFEINSPKATPFRMKKRLGRISIEETVKQESFAANKIDCREVAVQKRAKCLPL